MSQARDTSELPRAVIHKQILDVAESRPDATMADIADRVPGASVDLVDRVLERYGDPADGPTGPSVDPTAVGSEHSGPEPEPESMPEDGTNPEQRTAETDHPDPSLTERQADVLRFIREHPDASQAELAGEFDVTRATISRWANDIPGFDWARRRELVDDFLDDEDRSDPSDNGQDAAGPPPDEEALDRLRRRLADVERRFDDRGPATNGLSPELVHKVVHACMHSEHISDEEELELIGALMAADRRR